jgi:hypothetical protein
VVKQVVYRAPKPLTPAEQTAEVENIFATVITDKILSSTILTSRIHEYNAMYFRCKSNNIICLSGMVLRELKGEMDG